MYANLQNNFPIFPNQILDQFIFMVDLVDMDKINVRVVDRDWAIFLGYGSGKMDKAVRMKYIYGEIFGGFGVGLGHLSRHCLHMSKPQLQM